MSRVLFSSASGSLFRVLFKKRPAASGSEFSLLLKNVQVLFSFWFRIQHIIKNCPGYYSAIGSGFSIFLVSTSLKNLGSPVDVPARPVFAQWRSSSRGVSGVQNRPEVTTPKMIKKGKRKVQGVPQSQIAALPRPQVCILFQNEPSPKLL